MYFTLVIWIINNIFIYQQKESSLEPTDIIFRSQVFLILFLLILFVVKYVFLITITNTILYSIEIKSVQTDTRSLSFTNLTQYRIT